MFSGKKVSILFLIFYLLIFLVEVYFIYTGKVNSEVYVKPLLMLTLIIMYVVYAEKISFIFFLIMLVSLVADYIFIYAAYDSYMLAGVILFSITHILYIILFYKDVRKISLKALLKTLIPFIISTGIVFYIIEDDISELLYYPIFIHGIILSILSAIIFLIYSKNNSKLNFKMFIGVYLFIIADCLYGVFRFSVTTRFFMVFVTLLYTVAQYLICRVMIVKSLKNKLS